MDVTRPSRPEDDVGERIARLAGIMARLRDPETGCPWDVEQDFASIAPYTIEEAYEVADAIEHDDMTSLKDELGDLQLQVVFHARMAEELGHFSLSDVLDGISDKMIRRHPHIFGREANSGEARPGWEAIKEAERAEKGGKMDWTGWPPPFPPCFAPKSCKNAPPAPGSTGPMPRVPKRRSPRKSPK